MGMYFAHASRVALTFFGPQRYDCSMMQIISIGDAELFTEVKGEGHPVLLVSGLGGRAPFWAHQVKPFAQEFKVVTHDHRGTGGSTRSKIAYSVEQMAGDVLRLMDALSIERASMVGHSTGGAITQYLALTHQDRLTSIVLSATWAGPTPYFEALFRLRARTLIDLGVEAYLEDGILRAYPPSVLIENEALLTEKSAERLAMFPGRVIEGARIEAVMAHDLRERLTEIQLPTLVICAADDQITPTKFSHELAELIPGAQKHILDMGGHFVPQVAVNEYNTIVLQFLRAKQRGET